MATAPTTFPTVQVQDNEERIRIVVPDPELKILTPVTSRRKKLSHWIGMRTTSFPDQVKTTECLRLGRLILSNSLETHKSYRRKSSPVVGTKPIRPKDYTGQTVLRHSTQLLAEESDLDKGVKELSSALGELDLSHLPRTSRRALKPPSDARRRERLIRNSIPVRPIPIPSSQPIPPSDIELRRTLARRRVRQDQVMSAFSAFFEFDLLRGEVKPRFRQKGRISEAEKEMRIKTMEILLRNSATAKGKSVPVMELRHALQTLRETPTLSEDRKELSTQSPRPACLLTLCSPKNMLMKLEQRLLTRERDRARVFAARTRQERYDNLKQVTNYLNKIEKSVALTPRPWIHKPRGAKWKRKWKWTVQRQRSPTILQKFSRETSGMKCSSYVGSLSQSRRSSSRKSTDSETLMSTKLVRSQNLGHKPTMTVSDLSSHEVIRDSQEECITSPSRSYRCETSGSQTKESSASATEQLTHDSSILNSVPPAVNINSDLRELNIFDSNSMLEPSCYSSSESLPDKTRSTDTHKSGDSSGKSNTELGMDDDGLKMPPPKFLPPRSRTRTWDTQPTSMVTEQAPFTSPGPDSGSPPNIQTKEAAESPEQLPERKKRTRQELSKVYTVRRSLAVHPGDVFVSTDENTNYVFSRCTKTVSEKTLRLLTTAYALKCSFTEHPAGAVPEESAFGKSANIQDTTIGNVRSSGQLGNEQTRRNGKTSAKRPSLPVRDMWRRRNYRRMKKLSLAEAKLRSTRRHETMLNNAAAFLSQTQTPSTASYGTRMRNILLPEKPKEVEAKSQHPSPEGTLTDFLDRMPSFSKLAECKEKGIPIESLNWASFLDSHQCLGCKLLCQSEGIKVLKLQDAGTTRSEVLKLKVPTTSPQTPDVEIIEETLSDSDGRREDKQADSGHSIIKNKLLSRNRTAMHHIENHERILTGYTGTLIPRNAEIEHTIELLRHRRQIQRRLEVLESDHTIIGLDDFPTFRPLQDSEIVRLPNTITPLIPLDRRLVQTVLCEATCVLLAHAGFTHATSSVVEVLSNALNGFFMKISGKLKAATEITAVGATHGFNDPMERTMVELGMSRGILGLRDYYQSRVIDCHRWILKDCVKLRSEYASKIALKVGYESNKGPGSVATGSVAAGNGLVSSLGSRPEIPPQKISLPNSSPSPVTPGNRSTIELLSAPENVSCPSPRSGSLLTTLRSSMELSQDQSNLLRLNFVEEVPAANSRIESGSTATSTFIYSSASPAPTL